MRRSQQGIGMVFVAGLLLLALAGSAYGGESASPATATAPPAEQGDAIPPPKVPLPPDLTPLFDGKSLDGWVQVPADSWTVKNGAMTSNGAGRGVIYTSRQFDGVYRIIFDVRHVSGKPDHLACVLVFCIAPLEGEKPLDALAGIQFQPPNGGHWDYRKGHNNAGRDEFIGLPHAKFDPHQWSRVELLVDSNAGTGRMAVAQPVGAKAAEVVQFKDPSSGRKGPLALQMHNKGLFDEYANIAVELEPTEKDLITVK